MCSLARAGTSSVDSLTPGEAAAVLRQARAFLHTPSAGLQLLAGKKLALLSPRHGDADATEFMLAAQSLGAHVSFVQAGLDDDSTDTQVIATARVLGQLYDAVECQHLPADLVRRVARAAGVPVFDGLATAEHPTAQLVTALEGDASAQAKRRCIVQAALLLSTS